jgi:hypothetical protein
MNFLYSLYELSVSIIDNMFSRRWWYIWFFQIVFTMILVERILVNDPNSNLYGMIIAWTTVIVALLNVEASYSDHVKSLLKRLNYLSMAKANMSETKAD